MDLIELDRCELCLLTSLMEQLSSSPRPGVLFSVRIMARPKSLIAHEPSALTSTFLLFRSRWDTAGLYTSNNKRKGECKGNGMGGVITEADRKSE